MFERRALLARERQSSFGRAGKRRFAVLLADATPLAFRQQVCGALQSPLGLDHLARGEAVLAASVLAERDRLGRSAHGRHRPVELLPAVAVPVDELREVAAGEGRLMAGHRVERR